MAPPLLGCAVIGRITTVVVDHVAVLDAVRCVSNSTCTMNSSCSVSNVTGNTHVTAEGLHEALMRIQCVFMCVSEGVYVCLCPGGSMQHVRA